MPQLLIAFLAAALATLGGREATRAARLGQAMGAGSLSGAAIILAVIVSSVAAAWSGGQLAALLIGATRQVIVAGLVVLAAVVVLSLRAGPAPREPTRSFAAITLVLLAAYAADAARLLILAIALFSGDPWATAAGGALGSGTMLLVAHRAGGQWENSVSAQWLRSGVVAVLLVSGLLIGLTAIG